MKIVHGAIDYNPISIGSIRQPDKLVSGKNFTCKAIEIHVGSAPLAQSIRNTTNYLISIAAPSLAVGLFI
jgi:hypothetical protein